LLDEPHNQRFPQRQGIAYFGGDALNSLPLPEAGHRGLWTRPPSSRLGLGAGQTSADCQHHENHADLHAK
jgi:hypothetical protein